MDLDRHDKDKPTVIALREIAAGKVGPKSSIAVRPERLSRE